MEPTLGYKETTLEGRLVAFERAWRGGLAPDLDSHWITPAPEVNECLHFITLDLEYRWRSASVPIAGSFPARPRVEAYLARFPALAAAESVLELAAAEYRARRLWGDDPEPAEYGHRFPDLAERLRGALARVDREIERERDDLPMSSVATAVDPPTFPSDALDVAGPPPIEGLIYQSVLGRGGMGVVYKAFDTKLGREVAVKTTPSDLQASDAERGRFQDEAFAVARINHPNIVTIHAVGEARGRPFLVIEYLEGGNLSDRIKTGPLPVREAAELARTLALAMQEAHDRGILHRDLKPSNILFTVGGRPKIADFGLAKRLEGESARTASGAILGTPSFMAPEQAQGRSREVGVRSDVYALGAILYHSLTGRPPFLGESPVETLKLVLETDPVSLRRIRLGLPRDLETICLKCLEKAPAKRYPSAAELALDLGRFLEGKPVRARRLGATARLVKWGRRHPWQSALAGSVVAAVVVVIGLIARHDRLLAAEIRKTERQAAQARLNYRQARATIRSMLDRADDESQRGTPRALDLRHDMLERALAFHREILGGGESDDPLVAVDLAATLSDDAVYLSTLGRAAESLASLRRAGDLYEKLHQRHPDDRESSLGLIRSLARLAILSPGGGAPDECVEFGRRAVELAAAFRAPDPDNSELLELEGMARHDHAVALAAKGRVDEAILEYDRAVEVRSRIDPGKIAGSALAIAESLTNKAVIQWSKMERFDDAEKTLRSARTLLLEPKFSPRDQRRLIQVRWQTAINLSGVLNDLKKWEDSIGITTEALTTIEPYRKQEPNDAQARTVSLSLHGNRGIALGNLGRHRESAQEWARVVELADPPIPVRYILMHLLEQIGAGDLAAAERFVDQAALDRFPAADDRYNMACVCARIAMALRLDKTVTDAAKRIEHSIAQSLRWLEAAREAGAFKDPGQRAHARTDPDLEILRDRPEFRALVAEPAAKK